MFTNTNNTNHTIVPFIKYQNYQTLNDTIIKVFVNPMNKG